MYTFNRLACRLVIGTVVACVCFLGLPASANVQSVLPDFYGEPGLNPNRDQVSANATENIDPFSGALNLSYTDVFIPGDGGLDIRVQRYYNSNNVYLSRATAGSSPPYLTLLQPKTTTGMGWTMHFGRVIRSGTIVNLCNTNTDNANDDSMNNPVLELPDGSQHILFVNATSYTGAIYVSKDNWVASCINTTTQGMLIISPDGTKYTMDYFRQGGHTYNNGVIDYAWYTTRIEDRYGNYLTVSYDTDPGTASPGKEAILKQISSSIDGRSVTFTYTDKNDFTKIRLTSITAGARTWTYNYTALTDYVGYYQLTDVTNPDSSHWRYTYWPRAEGAAGNRILQTVTYPYGAVVSYDYKYTCFMGLDCPGNNANTLYSLTVATKTNGGTDVTPGTWTYNYAPSTTEDVTTVTFPGGSYVYHHVGSKVLMGGSTQCGTTVWKVGLLTQKDVYSGSTLVNRELYTWGAPYKISNEYYVRPPFDGSDFNHPKYFDCDVYAPVLQRKDIVRDGTTYTTTYSNFDTSYNPQTITETGQISRTTYLTYFPRTPGQNIVGMAKDEILEGSSTSCAQTSAKNICRTFNSNGTLKNITRRGVLDQYTYFTTGDINTHTDANGKIWTYSSYYRGIPRTEKNPELITTTRLVNDTGTIASETNGLGFTTSYLYDGMNRVSSITRPIGTRTIISWVPDGRLVTRGAYSQDTTFDGFGRPSRIDTNGIVQNINYDARGNRSFVSYPGLTTGDNYTTDTLGRPTSVTHADNTTQMTRYFASNVVSVTNERDYTTNYTYRSFGDPDRASDKVLMRIDAPEAVSAVFVRDILGLPGSVTQGGVTRSYTYNLSNNFLLTETHPETGVTTYTRDGVGNMRTRKVGASGLTTYTYDNINRLKTIDYPGTTPDVTLTYDNNNNLKKVVSSVVTRWLDYDNNNNLIGEKLSFGAIDLIAGYGYDGLDYLASVVYPSFRTVAYNPDALGRPTKVGSYASNVQHHPNGIPSHFNYANGQVEDIAINGNMRQWISSIRSNKLGTELAEDISYGYDGIGNVTSLVNALNSTDSKTMSYDGLDRLTRAGVASMTYDTASNLRSMTTSAGTLTYTYGSSSNRLDSVAGFRPYTFAYDVYGNVGGNSRNTFVYDDAGSLRTVGGTSTALYDYDGKNQRVRSQVGGITTLYFYSSAGLLLGEYDATGNWKKEYAYLGNKLAATIENAPDVAPSTPGSVTVPATSNTGSYTVSWTAATPDVSPITLYDVEEATTSNFTTPTLVYSGPALSRAIGGKTGGTFYYHVRACSGTMCSTYVAGTNGVAVTVPPPSAPGGITVPATNSTGSYSITWTAVSGVVAGYELQQATDPAFTNATTIYNGTGLSAALTGRLAGTYYYQVRACNASGCSNWTIGSNATQVLLPAAPGIPASITVPATDSDGSYSVSWGASTGTITRYELEESTDSAFGTSAVVYSGTSRTVALAGRTIKTYYYRTRACLVGATGTACSNWRVGTNATVVKVVPPSIPASITVPTIDNDGAYTISWGASSTGTVSYYELVESTAAWPYLSLYRGTNRSYKIIGNNFYTEYRYQVRACHENSAGAACSDWRYGSNAVSVVISGTAPGSPTSISAPQEDYDGNYKITWGAASGVVTRYELWESISGDWSPGYSLVYSGTNLYKDITGKQINTHYYYRVRACNTTGDGSSCGESVNTNAVNILPDVPGEPLSITFPSNNSTGNYTVSWAAPDYGGSITRYELEESTVYNFSSTSQIYSGTGFSKDIIGKASGGYYYRVRACNNTYCSYWCREDDPIVVTR